MAGESGRRVFRTALSGVVDGDVRAIGMGDVQIVAALTSGDKTHRADALAELTALVAFATVMETSPYWATRSPVPQTDEWSRCMLKLALEICRDHLDGRQELSEIQLAAI